MALIEVRGLTKFYRMGTALVRALDGVDLQIGQGEFVAITGPSGSGKSTLMHLLGCLDRPTGGRYVLGGRDVSDLSDRQLADIRNRQIGFVFQTFNLINRTSALANVAVPLFYARQGNTHGPARKALERVGLAERALHRSNELSGGERQRVAIARAMVNNPLLLLADEPTGNLDSRTGQQIMDVFRALNAQGVTVLVVTHEYDVAIQARRIVQMRDGRIVSDCPADDLRRAVAAPGVQGAAAVPDVLSSPALLQSGGEPLAQARPAAVAAMTPPPAARKLARGARAALVTAAVAACLLAGAITIGKSVGPPPADFKYGDPVPKELAQKLTVASLAALGVLAAMVLGIIAVVLGRRVLRRTRDEPGNWKGAGRAWTAIGLGLLVALGPVLAFLVRAAWRWLASRSG